uniref:Dynein axonemal intermediate chain 4 n=1 Tax=Ciona intestinalis TaxID=7719 RepID=A0A6S6MEM1_CIOIN|nr:WD repeat-containing protein 78 [Ciona intestinalis]BCG62024.1 WD repeat-containing protein 78 [Ciona intestinalis]|eukprot:XP_002131353.1 WD repeat-containing protein 78 [Ciona intestinalis]
MSKVVKSGTKGNVFTSKAMKKSSIMNTKSQSRFTSRRSDISVSHTHSRRSVTLSESKLTDGKSAGGQRLGLIVLDEDGNDVTPKPLHSYDPTVQKSGFFGSDNQSTVGTPTDVMSFTSVYQSFAQPFSRSIYGSTSNRSAKSKRSSIESSGEITESGPEVTTGFADVMTVRREEVEDLTDEDLNKMVDVILEETDTIWMFEQKGIAVSEESEESQIIQTKNTAYEELCKTKEGNDRFAERGMQTFNFAQKHKEIQAEKVGLTDAAINVTSWDMYDTYASKEEPPTSDSNEGIIEKRGRSLGGGGERRGSRDGSVGTSRVTESRASMLTMSVMGEPEPDPSPQPTTTETNETGVNPQWEKISNSESILKHLVVMERVVTENIYQPKQATYRGMSVLIDPDKEMEDAENATGGGSPDIMTAIGPTIDRLWSYSSPMTKGRNVSSMTWNKVNPDILAVGYGQFGFNEQNKNKGSLTCCWNLKNPEFPERVFHSKASVTALDFSSVYPNLLAVGLYDGTVCIYNVRNMTDQPVVDSFDCTGKHSSPVWQLCWIERERGLGEDRSEILISISADGRVVQWSIRKGFECSDLMKLKRTGSKNPQKKKEKAEALISRQAPGMCFDFHAKDSNMYLAGTEEGLIHKCSCSYNEQFLDTYTGHTGPLYKVRWSPYCPDVFLSCSSDWSIRLWKQTELKPVLNFFSTTKAVHDICWSPYSSTVFCAVNEGAVEIWDLKTNTLDPLITNLASPGMKFSCAIFSLNSNSVLVGDSDGHVSVYQLRNMSDKNEDKDASALSNIMNSTISSQVDKNSDEKRKE